MTQIDTGVFWANVDVSDESENWTVDIDNASRRMGCSALAPNIVASSLNHLLGRTGHIVFAMATPQVAATYLHPDNANALNPLYEAMIPDYHREATNYRAVILSFPPDRDLNWAGWTNTYFSTNALGSGVSANALYDINSSDQNYYQETRVDIIDLPRGNVTNSNQIAVLNAYGGARIIDVIIYGQSADTLDSTMDHGFVEPAKAKSAKPVLDDLAEDCRARLAEIRTQAIPPVATWCAQGTGTGFSNAGTSPGDQLGMVVNVASDQVNNRVNLMDHAITSRNSDTPGIYVHSYRQGIGPEDTVNGTTIRHAVHVLAHVTNAECNGKLYAESKWSNSTLTIDRNTPTWVTIEDVITNSAWDESIYTDDEGALRTNKIDLYGSVNQGALYVHSITVARKVPQTA